MDLGNYPVSYSKDIGSLIPWVKRSDLGAELPPTAKSRMSGSVLHFSIHLHGVHRDKFILNLYLYGAWGGVVVKALRY